MKFRVTTKEVFRRSGIIVEVSEESLLKLKKRGVLALPPDYWKFLPSDPNIDESCLKPTRRILTHAQVYKDEMYHLIFLLYSFLKFSLFFFLLFLQIYALLYGIDQRLIREDIPMFDSVPMFSFPVTPNGYRVTEVFNQFTGARLVFVS